MRFSRVLSKERGELWIELRTNYENLGPGIKKKKSYAKKAKLSVHKADKYVFIRVSLLQWTDCTAIVQKFFIWSLCNKIKNSLTHRPQHCDLIYVLTGLLSLISFLNHIILSYSQISQIILHYTMYLTII